MMCFFSRAKKSLIQCLLVARERRYEQGNGKRKTKRGRAGDKSGRKERKKRGGGIGRDWKMWSEREQGKRKGGSRVGGGDGEGSARREGPRGSLDRQ